MKMLILSIGFLFISLVSVEATAKLPEDQCKNFAVEVTDIQVADEVSDFHKQLTELCGLNKRICQISAKDSSEGQLCGGVVKSSMFGEPMTEEELRGLKQEKSKLLSRIDSHIYRFSNWRAPRPAELQSHLTQMAHLDKLSANEHPLTRKTVTDVFLSLSRYWTGDGDGGKFTQDDVQRRILYDKRMSSGARHGALGSFLVYAMASHAMELRGLNYAPTFARSFARRFPLSLIPAVGAYAGIKYQQTRWAEERGDSIPPHSQILRVIPAPAHLVYFGFDQLEPDPMAELEHAEFLAIKEIFSAVAIDGTIVAVSEAGSAYIQSAKWAKLAKKSYNTARTVQVAFTGIRYLRISPVGFVVGFAMFEAYDQWKEYDAKSNIRSAIKAANRQERARHNRSSGLSLSEIIDLFFFIEKAKERAAKGKGFIHRERLQKAAHGINELDMYYMSETQSHLIELEGLYNALQIFDDDSIDIEQQQYLFSLELLRSNPGSASWKVRSYACKAADYEGVDTWQKFETENITFDPLKLAHGLRKLTARQTIKDNLERLEDHLEQLEEFEETLQDLAGRLDYNVGADISKLIDQRLETLRAERRRSQLLITELSRPDAFVQLENQMLAAYEPQHIKDPQAEQERYGHFRRLYGCDQLAVGGRDWSQEAQRIQKETEAAAAGVSLDPYYGDGE